ncbi:MAG: hypothetical protein K1X83_07350 [Oligoflexia bacterium]|nr:hypothetical protein [Oligoflexia bacterium]
MDTADSRGQKKLDLWLALLLALISLGITTATYAAVHRLEQPAATALTAIDKGQTIFLVRHSGGCAGEFKAELSTHKNITINAKGSIQTRVDARLISASISFSALFNPLGQMYSSELSINAPNAVSLALKTDGVNPLTLAISSSAAGQSYSGKLDLPGPVIISESQETRDRYLIEYEPANRFKPLRNQNLMQNLVAPIGMHIEQRRAATEICEIAPLDLSGAAALVQQFSKGGMLNAVLPEGVPHD